MTTNILTHPIGTRVTLPGRAGPGTIIEHYKRLDQQWRYSVELDSGGIIHGLTDDDVRLADSGTDKRD